MGLRSVSVGADTDTYQYDFDLISQYSIMSIIQGKTKLAMEIGFQLFMKLFSMAYDSYYLFQFVFSVVYIVGMSKFLKENCENITYGTVLFLGLELFLTAFNIQRQSLSVMLAINGWSSFNKGNKKRGIMLWLIAFLFHRTAILFIMANILNLIKEKKRLLRVSVVVVILIGLNYRMFLPIAQRLMPFYRNYYKNAKTIHTAGMVWAIWLIIISIAVIMLFSKKKYNSDDRVIAIYSSLYVIMNIIGLNLNYAERIGLFFLPFCVLLFERFQKQFNSYHIKIVYNAGVIISFLAYFLLSACSEQYTYSFLFMT